MDKTVKIAIIIAALATVVSGQTGSPIPWANVQFTDTNGLPLSSGRVYSCVGGSACPGTTQATYTGSNLLTVNTNPVILNASGRAQIWLTPGLVYTFVVTDQFGTVIPLEGLNNVVGSAASTSSGGGGGGGGGSAAGSSTYVQFNTAGAFDASGNFTFNKATQQLTVTGVPGTAGIVSSGGFMFSTGGFNSAVTGGSWQGFNSATDGALLRGYGVGQNTAGTAGGYFDLAPITYNPNGGGSCTDVNGNPVQQPLPLNGLSAFGSNDVLLWNGTSPQMPVSGCGAALPVLVGYGLNTNGYIFARGGLATDNPRYNAINTIYPGAGAPAGGVEAGAIIAGTLYPAGTVTSTGTLSTPTYLGGYVQIGISSGPPAAGTIASVTNPLVNGDSLEAGTIYWDSNLNCINSYNGSGWACLGTGGSGTPGGANTQVQFNNSGSFAGNANLIWNNTSKILTVTSSASSTYGLYVATGFGISDKGWASINCTVYNCFQVTNSGSSALTGGMAALSFTAQNYIQSGNSSGAPSPTSGDTFHAGALYWDTGSSAEKVYNGSAWISLGGGSGSPGGANTNIQFNSSGAFGGSGNLTFNSGTQLLMVTGTSSSALAVNIVGYAQATLGFNAQGAAYNAISAANGGIGQILSGTFQNYVQVGQYSSGGVGNPPPLTTSDAFHPGTLSWDTFGGGVLRVFDGTNWDALGGSGGVAGANTQLQYNNSGAFGASSNLTWNGSDLVAIGIASTQTFWAKNGYALADGGFVAPVGCVLYNCIQSQGGGGYFSKSMRAGSYTGTGNSTGVPTATSGDTSFPVRGDMYFDNGAGVEKLWNGSIWASLATGGIPSLNTLTGALSITGTANEISVNASGSTINLFTPQQIATTSNVTFNTVTANGSNSFVSTTTGTNYAFVANGGTFLLQGNGQWSSTGAAAINGSTGSLNLPSATAPNSIQTAGGVNVGSIGGSNGVYEVNGSVVISNAGAFVGAGVNVGANGISGGGYNINGGFIGQTYTVTFTGGISGIGGCSSGLIIKGGVIVSCF